MLDPGVAPADLRSMQRRFSAVELAIVVIILAIMAFSFPPQYAEAPQPALPASASVGSPS